MATWKKVVVESASGTITQDTTGNAATATTATTASALATARTIGLSGDVSGSASFDGSANITISATVADDSHNHTISNVDGLQTALDAKQAADADLTAIAGLSNADGNFIVGNGSTWVAESGATVRSSLGLGSLATKSAIVTGDITDGTILEADLNVTNTPTAGQILSYASAGGGFTWIANTAAANDSTVTLSAGTGLSGGGSFTTNQSGGSTVTFNVDFGEFTETAVTVADDYIVFLDGSGTGAERKESIADLVTAMTGNNLASQNGVIQLTTNPDIAGTLDVTGVATFDNNVTIAGDLTVNGTTTTVNSTTVEVADKMLKLANVATPTTTTANGGGIQLESSATAAEWPELKWNSSGNLAGWTVSDHTATSSTDFPIAIMEFGTAAPSSPAIETEGGAGSFFADTTNGNLYLYI